MAQVYLIEFLKFQTRGKPMSSQMALHTLLPLIATLALCAPAALAQEATPLPMGHHAGLGGAEKGLSLEDIGKMHAHWCNALYAHEAGALTTLEVELQLSDKQKPAFDRWKAIKLATAKAHADACSAGKMPPPPDQDKAKGKAPPPVEGLKIEMQHLKDRLADIKAELPALEALAATLTDEQLHTLLPHGGPHAGHGGPHNGPNEGPESGLQNGPGIPPPPTD